MTSVSRTLPSTFSQRTRSRCSNSGLFSRPRSPTLPEIGGRGALGVVRGCCYLDTLLVAGLEGGGWSQWWPVSFMTSRNSTPVESWMASSIKLTEHQRVHTTPPRARDTSSHSYRHNRCPKPGGRMTWCVPFRAVAPWAEKCCSLSNLAKSPTDPVVCDGRTTWVRFFTHTKAAVSTEMGVCVCGWGYGCGCGWGAGCGVCVHGCRCGCGC